MKIEFIWLCNEASTSILDKHKIYLANRMGMEVRAADRKAHTVPFQLAPSEIITSNIHIPKGKNAELACVETFIVRRISALYTYCMV